MKKNPFEEEIKSLKPLIDFGFKSIKITYNGGGDEGAVDQIDIEFSKYGVSEIKRKSFEQLLIDLTEKILEQTEMGWEINEGSEGVLTITQEQKGINIKLAHTRFYTESEGSDYKFNFTYKDICQ